MKTRRQFLAELAAIPATLITAVAAKSSPPPRVIFNKPEDW